MTSSEKCLPLYHTIKHTNTRTMNATATTTTARYAFAAIAKRAHEIARSLDVATKYSVRLAEGMRNAWLEAKSAANKPAALIPVVALGVFDQYWSIEFEGSGRTLTAKMVVRIQTATPTGEEAMCGRSKVVVLGDHVQDFDFPMENQVAYDMTRSDKYLQPDGVAFAAARLAERGYQLIADAYSRENKKRYAAQMTYSL